MNRNTAAKRAARVAGALLAATGLVAAGASGAQAAVIKTDFVQWYNSGYSGGCVADNLNDGSFYNDYFNNCGQGAAGVGAVVANNTESYYNYDFVFPATVYTGAWFAGASAVIQPRTGGNYSPLGRNNVESLFL